MASLLKGTASAIIAENVRALKQRGVSESDAVSQANRYAKEERDDPEDDHEGESHGDVADDLELAESRPDAVRQFVLVTKDFSGLGWAKKLLEEGETVTVATSFKAEDDPELRKQMKMVGEGWVEVVDLPDAMRRLKSPSTYWVFTENNFPVEADKLRAQGQKVFGTSALTDKLEHDRQYGVDIAEQAGLQSPPTHEFTSRDEGLAFLDDHLDTAFVFKPDDGKFNYLTFVPVRKKSADANREVYNYLAHMKQEPGTFILQERLAAEDVTEVNVELWFYEGEPFLATLGLEVKRKNTYDLGEMCGCGGDFMQFIDMECKLVDMTIGKMVPFYREQKYTGFADVNVLLTKDNTPYFLEVCDRFGYNSHPNMFLNLAKEGFGSILADFMDGKVDGMRNRFRDDIGCSMTVFLDHPRPGLPVHVDPAHEAQFFPFDGYKEDEGFFLTGYSDEVGIYCDHAPTIKAAAEKVYRQIVDDEAVSYPDIYYRYDLAKDDYYNAPVRRYQTLQDRGLL